MNMGLYNNVMIHKMVSSCQMANKVGKDSNETLIEPKRQ